MRALEGTSALPVTVDAYAHCGVNKYLPVEALDQVMRAADVSRAVLCQHLGEYDNTYIGRLIHNDPARFAGVGLVDHASSAWTQAIDALVAAGFRGVRITSVALVENARLGPTVASVGLVPVIYAPEGISSIVPRLFALSRAYRDVPIVVTHLGNPAVDGTRLERASDLLALADAPNVHVVLSGLDMFCNFPYTPLDDLIEGMVDIFGAGRIMWGSNFPVCGEDVVAYTRTLDLVLSGRCWGIDGGVGEAISETTATSVWFQ